MGHSPCHSGTVALVLNPNTLHVSPQYHVVFDDEFTMVNSLRNGELPNKWLQLVTSSSELVMDQDFELSQTWATQ